MRLKGAGSWGMQGLTVSPPPPDASRSLPDFSELDLQGKVLPEGIGPGDIKAFQVLYREHCEVGHLGSGQGRGRAALPLSPLEHPASPTGHRRCHGEPAVHPGGDAVENLLEVQPEPAQRGTAAGCVSAFGGGGRKGGGWVPCESAPKAGAARPQTSCRSGGSSLPLQFVGCTWPSEPASRVCIGTGLMLGVWDGVPHQAISSLRWVDACAPVCRVLRSLSDPGGSGVCVSLTPGVFQRQRVPA